MVPSFIRGVIRRGLRGKCSPLGYALNVNDVDVGLILTQPRIFERLFMLRQRDLPISMTFVYRSNQVTGLETPTTCCLRYPTLQSAMDDLRVIQTGQSQLEQIRQHLLEIPIKMER
jgi:uncharacterized membrane protein (UPF0127 family)